MVHVDPPALGIGIDTVHPRKNRTNRKRCASSHNRHVLEHCSAGNTAQERPGTWPGRNLGNDAAFTRIGRQSAPSFLGKGKLPSVTHWCQASEAKGWQLVRGRARPFLPWASLRHGSQFTGQDFSP